MALINKIKLFVTSARSRMRKSSATMQYGTLTFVVLFLSGLHFSNFHESVPAIYLFVYLLFYVLFGLLVSIFIVWILKLLPFIPSACKITIVFAYLWIFYFLHIPNVYGWTLISVLIISPILILSGWYQWKRGSLFPFNSTRKLLGSFAILASSAALIMCFFVFFDSGGNRKDAINYKMEGNLPDPLNLPNPAVKDSYTPVSFSYGTGNDQRRSEFGRDVKILTGTVDASRLLTSWKGISGKLRTLYFGFDEKTLPLNALLWYPKEKEGPLPLVMIIHGNHLAQDPSDPGYAYLGELLASKGYLVVSIDQNFLNTSFTDLEIFGQRLENENAARAWLLLKHIQLFRIWNSTPSHFFHHKIDMNKIAIIGHSRGGEAVGHAAVFNKLSHYPDDAKEVFDFNFNIRSVIAIAPVDGQYKPSGKLVKIKDVNYFVLHGALDMDMQSYAGLATLKRVEFSKEFEGFKAGLYMSNANHGQFNGSWGRKDGISPGINRFNLDQLMSKAEQEMTSSVYISSFLEITLNEKEEYKALFMDARYGRKWLPNLIYLNQYEPSKKIVIADFEEDVDVQTTTIPKGRISSSGLQEWKEQENKLMWGHGLSKAVYLAWDSTETKKESPWFSFNLSAPVQNTDSIKTLSFSLANSKENLSNVEQAIDFTIELEDSGGQSFSFLLSQCSYLQPQIAKNISKFRILDDSPNSETIPDHFYYNLRVLAKSNALFQVNSIKQIKLVFDKTASGAIVLDDVYLTN